MIRGFLGDNWINPDLWTVSSPNTSLDVLISACCGAVEVVAARSAGIGRVRASAMRALPYLMALSFLTFPMVTSIAFQAFSCEDFDDGSSYLKARCLAH